MPASPGSLATTKAPTGSAPRAAARTPDAQHCVVCHWLQSVQTLVTASGAAAPPTDCHQLTVSVLPLAGAAALEQIAARAPPRS